MFETKYGYFTDDGKEFVITTPKTPKPWINVISNGDYGMIISQSGSGYSWRTHASLNRITRWEQDLIKDEWGKYIYIKDDTSGDFWSPSWKPTCTEPQEFKVRYGQGYSIFETKYFDIKTNLTMFVSKNDPVEIWKLTIKNTSEKERRLSVYTYLEWNLGAAPDWHREFHKTFIETDFLNGLNCITAEKRMWEIPNEKGQNWNRNWEYTAFHSVNEKIAGFEGSKEKFLGQYGSISNPNALISGEMSNNYGKWEDSIASLKNEIILKPGEEKTLIYLLGAASKKNTNESVGSLVKKYQTVENVEEEFKKVKDMWGEMLSKFTVETPDKAVDFMLNNWLKYQAISGRLWGRSAYYQTGGAYGYRDQLQDSQIFLYVDPEQTKNQIRLHAAHQFKDGSVYHWWHPISELGYKNNISDNRLWLPFVVLRFLKETNDLEFLKEIIKFLDGGESSLYDHCIRAIHYNLNHMSSRGLPLIGDGDWNDGMNAVGTQGKGESIWLGHFLYGILKDFSVVCKKMGDLANMQRFMDEGEKLKENINKYAWDGEWYVRAFKDNGEPIGSKQNSEGKIFLNAQTWAIINDTATQTRSETAYRSAKKYLFKDYGPLLFQPAFFKPDPEIGYLSRYAPGVRENGGLYTHAGTWAILAASKMKDPETYKIYKSFMPIYRGLEPDKYLAEPYVTPGNVDGPDSPYFGRGGWTWYTGSAAWYFIVGVEGIFGLKPEWEGLRIEPMFPEDWKEVKVKRIFRGKQLNITYKKSDERKILINGVEIDGNIINPELFEESILNVEVLF
ncbi:GH36-type glycosyl hydrolase domain-containing protein [Petrotoga sibirica]|uniref:Cellobiose phosphorylase n=2 Tax=Petrotoga sibirica TaxID=156202 RepID=A0A4R8EXF4_9BACT|nr:glycosyl transferase family 36 [Petrotoga sibirica]POZ88795.1 glycosyl transferase family 36 [Petrotoga sibirica DSM 13575]TDX17410.1 cellobiose phosphorylase [Petrotoga sibirica]